MKKKNDDDDQGPRSDHSASLGAGDHAAERSVNLASSRTEIAPYERREFAFPLRPGVFVYVRLPSGLTQEDLDRIAAWLPKLITDLPLSFLPPVGAQDGPA